MRNRKFSPRNLINLVWMLLIVALVPWGIGHLPINNFWIIDISYPTNIMGFWLTGLIYCLGVCLGGAAVMLAASILYGL